MDLTALNKIQQETAIALEQLSEKAQFTEFILAKKLRENGKIDGKNKAGVALADMEKAIEYLAEEKSIFYSIHVNSVNTILLKKAESYTEMDKDARKRRQTSEKSMSILTNSDFSNKKSSNQKSNGNSGKKQHRSERKKININDDFERWE